MIEKGARKRKRPSSTTSSSTPTNLKGVQDVAESQGGAAKACAKDCDCAEGQIENQSVSPELQAELLAVTHPSPLDSKKQAATDTVVFVEQPANLKAITGERVQLAVWRRPAPGFVATLADPSIDPNDLPAFEGLVTPDDAAATLKEALSGAPYALRSRKNRPLTDAGIDELVGEVDQLVRVFAKVSESEAVFIKLEVVDDNGCAFWHQDCVPYRLVATYRGPCTEWVHPDNAKATLGRRRFNSKHARALCHHDVALFKGRGETFKGDALLNHPGIVHRSPRTEGSGVYRVVLVLDTPKMWQLQQP